MINLRLYLGVPSVFFLRGRLHILDLITQFILCCVGCAAVSVALFPSNDNAKVFNAVFCLH